MNEKILTCECTNCESSFGIQYYSEYVSKDEPQYCPFCSELIEDIQEEEYIEEDDFFEDENWENDY